MNPTPERDRSDEELALRAAACPESAEGREAASIVFGRWVSAVYRWCYGYVRDRDLAEDLAQDVLLRAYSHLHEFEGWGRFSAWLFVISRNVCLDAVRRRARDRREDLPLESLPDPGGNPEAALEDGMEELWRMIRPHLTDQEQEAIWLRCFERMPVDLITGVLGIESRSGARAVLQSARRKLRRAMRKPSPPLWGLDDDD